MLSEKENSSPIAGDAIEKEENFQASFDEPKVNPLPTKTIDKVKKENKFSVSLKESRKNSSFGNFFKNSIWIPAFYFHYQTQNEITFKHFSNSAHTILIRRFCSKTTCLVLGV